MKVTVSTLLLIFFVHAAPVFSFDSTNVVFTIVSQNEPYLASVTSLLVENIQEQILTLENRTAAVHATHLEFPIPGAWTIVPLLRPLVTKHRHSDVRWVVFLEPHTAVNCQKLLEALSSADDKDVKWIGYPLSDYEPTIIHHFTFYDELEEDGGLVYPNFASGFAMNMQLMKTLLSLLENGERRLKADFSIDPAFELAQLVYGSGKDPGPLLTTDLSFCILSGDNCATYPRQFELCGSAIPERSVLFAVKTWSGNHHTRLKVVKKTWGSLTTHIRFYSDVADPVQNTIDIGVPNSKTGHCVKTISILKDAVRYAKQNPEIKWIFLADDDTILGVQRLLEVLSCYRGGESFSVLGERYGYGYLKKETKGYDYITGGGGTAFSVSAAAILSRCACAGISAPDDMTLGACAMRNNYSIVHSPLFHQARPQDYPREVLSRDRPVSFHRHSSPDPVKVYVTWFQHDDLNVKKTRDEL